MAVLGLPVSFVRRAGEDTGTRVHPWHPTADQAWTHPYHAEIPMKLIVNGEPTELAENQTVRALIEKLGLGGKAVAVEVNKQIVPKRRHGEATLRDGDAVEIVTLVGGG